MEKIFKAKRVDNGEWVEFNILKDSISHFGESLTYVTIPGVTIFGDEYRIDKDTICEYAGINDKERNRIFNGDEIYVAGVGNVIVEMDFDGIMFGDESGYDCIDDIERLTGNNIHDKAGW